MYSQPNSPTDSPNDAKEKKDYFSHLLTAVTITIERVICIVGVLMIVMSGVLLSLFLVISASPSRGDGSVSWSFSVAVGCIGILLYWESIILTMRRVRISGDEGMSGSTASPRIESDTSANM